MHFIVRRVGQAALVLAVTYVLTYVLLTALPGDGVIARYGSPELGLSPEQLEEIRQAYGADQPGLVRFWNTLVATLTGNFGYSVQSGASVSTLLQTNVPPTLVLAVLSFAAGVLLAGVLAVTSTFASFRWLRRVFAALPPVFISVPTFWLGILLIQIFSFQLRLVPIINASPVQGIILPIATIAVPISAPLAQVLIRGIEEVEAQPFITVVKAKGASAHWLLWRNVLKNALLPSITIAGLLFGELIAGAVVTEAVFSRNGIGQLTAQAVQNRDTPVLQAVVIISTVGYVLINLVVDLLYPVLDPRLRKQALA